MADVTRRVFYSFHYKPDVFRVSQVRNIGKIEDNKPATDNDWESITGISDPKKRDAAIERWINGQMEGRSCLLVIVGENTAKRKWIDYEITKAWSKGMGVAGIRINGLNCPKCGYAKAGANPFSHFTLGEAPNKKQFDSIVKCYTPDGVDGSSRYRWIASNLSAIIEEAIAIRKKY